MQLHVRFTSFNSNKQPPEAQFVLPVLTGTIFDGYSFFSTLLIYSSCICTVLTQVTQEVEGKQSCSTQLWIEVGTLCSLTQGPE